MEIFQQIFEAAPDALLVTKGGHVHVLWNDDGVLRGDAPDAAVKPPGSDGPGLELGGVLAATTIDLGGEPGRELLVSGDSGTYLVRRSGRDFIELTPLEHIAGGLTLAAGDLSGDGVEDLLVGSGTSLRLFRGMAAP